MSSLHSLFRLMICGLVVCGATYHSMAVEPSAVLNPNVNDDTFAVARLKLGSLKIADDGSPIASLLPPFAVDAQARVLLFRGVAAAVNSFQSAGVTDVYAIVGLRDVAENRGPLVILQLKSGADSHAVETMVTETLKILDSLNSVLP